MSKQVSRRMLAKARSSLRSQPWAMLPDYLSELQHTAAARVVERQPVNTIGYTLQGNVAVIDVTGPLTKRVSAYERALGFAGYEQMQAALDAANADPTVSAIVVNIDSPGGSAVGAREAATAMRNSAKPVYAIANSMAASAAYYLASGAHRFFAAPGGVIGSIGVFAVHTDVSRMRQDFGITDTIISAGENKAADTSLAPLSEQGRSLIQEEVDAYYQQFVSDVAANRRVGTDVVLSTFGQGKTFTAEDAFSRGMIDGVKTLSQVIALASGGATKNMNAGTAAPALMQQQERRSTEEVAMNRIVAQLFAMGLLQSLEADQATVTTAVASFCEQRGVSVPSGEEAILALLREHTVSSLRAQNTAASAAIAAPANTHAPAAPAATATSATTVNTQPSATPTVDTATYQRIAAEESHRRSTISAIARGYGFAADDPAVVALTEDVTCSISTAATRLLAARGANETPVNVRRADARVNADSGITALHQDTQAALSSVIDRMRNRESTATLTDNQRRLSRTPLSRIARQYLQASGARIDDSHTDEQIARWAIGAHNPDVRMEMIQAGVSISAVNSPASFPTLFSALMNRELEQPMESSPYTYRNWTSQLGSVPDFRPKTIIQFGGFNYFGVQLDNKDPEEDTIAEDASWLITDRFSKKWQLTARMITDNDLGAFADTTAQMNDAWQRTINFRCLELLATNPNTNDGFALFSSQHGNNKTPGAGISVTELAAMDVLLLNQRDITRPDGSTGRVIGAPMNYVLYGTANHNAAHQVLNERIVMVPTADASANRFRGMLPYDVDPMLNEFGAGYAPWFTFSMRPGVRPIVFCFQQGYESLQQRQQFNFNTGGLETIFESRFGCAVRNWRGVARNVGA